MPSMWTVQASGDTRPYQTSQNSRTIMPHRPKPTPTSRTRSGAIFISASTQKGMFCQLLVPILLARTEDALELVDESTLCHREPAEPALQLVEPHGHRMQRPLPVRERALRLPQAFFERGGFGVHHFEAAAFEERLR